MPKYETAAQRKDEAAARKALGEHFKCKVHQFPVLSPVDCYLFTQEGQKVKGPMIGIAEVKGKNQKHDQYPHVYCDVNKGLALVGAEAAFGVPGLWVVKFTDGVYVLSARLLYGHKVMVIGREDRGDPNDIEPAWKLPAKLLRPLDDVPLLSA